MNRHCKDCRYHHNAGHPKDSPKARRYNDWCCKYGTVAREIVGHCKLFAGKEVKA